MCNCRICCPCRSFIETSRQAVEAAIDASKFKGFWGSRRPIRCVSGKDHDDDDAGPVAFPGEFSDDVAAIYDCIESTTNRQQADA